MNIDEIYIKILTTEDDSKLIELAKSEVMVIPFLVELMLNNEDCRAQNLLIKLSEQTPLLVYPYFNYIAQAFEKYNNFLAWNSWRIIANLLIVDYLEMWENIKDKYFLAFKSENITEILALVSTAKTVINHKPNDAKIVTKLVKDCVNNQFTICNEPAPHINAVAKQAVDVFFNN